MPKYNRIFTIVIDSLGTGAMPDSEKFGDVGVDTLGHIAEHMELGDDGDLHDEAF